MAHIIKKGPIKVPTQPKDFDLQATGLVFKSYDNQIALEFNVVQQDGTPADLLGANLRLLMFIHDEVDGTIKKEPIPFITKNLITKSFLNGHVVYILPEAMKAYNGMVEAYVYIEYPDGSTSDNLGFTFRIKRSAIDGLAQDKADYFIEDFKQLLEAASLEANKVIEGLDTEIKNLQQAAKDANTAVDGAMDRIDGLEAEIGQLERLREMYIDTLDFEGYNYSVRPNLMRNIKLEDLSLEFTRYIKPTNVTMENGCFVIDVTKLTGNQGYYILDVPRGLEGKRYTYSVEAKADVATQGVAIRPVYHNGSALAVLTPSSVGSLTTTMTRYKLTTNALTAQQVNSTVQSFQIYIVPSDCTATKIYVKTNIKMEEGTEASEFQPNLLAEPYNMCREYPNENMVINNDPVTNNAYLVKNYQIKPLVKGKKYTLTLKGTKPSTQTWRPFFTQDNGNPWGTGDMTPVPGLPNVWIRTFTASANSHPTGPAVQIYQAPSTSVGQCKIEWCKLEEGEVSTPIDVPTYKGLGILDSNDPTKYVWNYTELVDVDGIQDALENVEQRTATLEGKANTIDGRLNNVNTALNTVQSTADQILAEVTAADVMKETDATYLATVAKTKELDRYKEYFSKGTSLGVDTINQTTIPFGASMGLHGTRAVTLNGGVFTATKQCKLLFDFSIKMRGNDKTGYIYVKPYKNGEKADEEACAAVGGFRDSTGATATLKFQNNTPLKYIAELNTGDTLEFKVEIGSSDKIQEVKMLFGTIEEI